MSVRDPRSWMPAEMLTADKNYFLSLHPDDPHAAAAEAWEAWASTLPDGQDSLVQSVTTGAQSITYVAGGASPLKNAQARAIYHRSRSNITSVIVGPNYTWSGNGGGQVQP